MDKSDYPSEPPPKYDDLPPAAGYPSGPAPPYPASGAMQPPYPPAAPQPYPAAPGAQYQTQYQPQPQAGYGGQPHRTTVIVQPAMGAMPGSAFHYGMNPALIVCQHCQATVTTSLDYQTGLLTWLLCGAACIMGLWCGCCCAPFCINGAKDVQHQCPNCNKTVGVFRHIR